MGIGFNQITTLTTSVDYETLECYKCDCRFAMTSEFTKRLRETKNTFHCPNGHPQSFLKSTLELLNEEIQQERDAHKTVQLANQVLREYRNSLQRRITSLKGVITKANNKIKKLTGDK